jgi:hypothetical protein
MTWSTIKRKTPLKRSGPPRKKRPGVRRGQPTREEKEGLRMAVYARAEGRCELNLGPKCIKGVLPYTADSPLFHGHLVHIKSRGAGGKWTMENCRWGCVECHSGYHHTTGIQIKTED